MEQIMSHLNENWVIWLFSGLSFVMGSLIAYLRKWKKEQDAIKEGVIALLHDRLYQGCTYFIRKKEISTAELKNMEYIYRGYHALGGNGTGTELFERTQDLPLKED